MAFRRKKKAAKSSSQRGESDGAVSETGVGEELEEVGMNDAPGEASTAESSPVTAIEVDRSSGPFDVSEADDQEMRIDLGGLQIPPTDDLKVRVDLDPQNQRPVGVTLFLGQGAVRIRPLSSPRSGGTWDEVRSDIQAEIEAGGGQMEEFAGEFGVELLATVKAQDPGSDPATQNMRFVGVEGPRWMLQGTFFGVGADPLTAGRINSLYRSVVVVRGDEPMPAKQPLAITVPEGDAAAVEASSNAVQERGDSERNDIDSGHQDAFDRRSGPYDIAEAEDDPERLDLGSLQIPFAEDLEINVEVDEDTDVALAVTLVIGQGAVQIRPFSAHGASGLWEDARAEIKAGISSDGGLVDEVAGIFGAELRAKVPAENEDGNPFIQTIRFVGVNGPDWMLQGIFLGEGSEPASAAELEKVFRSVVVDSKSQVLPAGEALPISTPEDLPPDTFEFEGDGSGQEK
jgi:hypothetical protein